MEEIFLDNNKTEVKLTRKDLSRILGGEILETYRGNRIGMVEG